MDGVNTLQTQALFSLFLFNLTQVQLLRFRRGHRQPCNCTNVLSDKIKLQVTFKKLTETSRVFLIETFTGENIE